MCESYLFLKDKFNENKRKWGIWADPNPYKRHEFWQSPAQKKAFLNTINQVCFSLVNLGPLKYSTKTAGVWCVRQQFWRDFSTTLTKRSRESERKLGGLSVKCNLSSRPKYSHRSFFFFIVIYPLFSRKNKKFLKKLI